DRAGGEQHARGDEYAEQKDGDEGDLPEAVAGEPDRLVRASGGDETDEPGFGSEAGHGGHHLEEGDRGEQDTGWTRSEPAGENECESQCEDGGGGSPEEIQSARSGEPAYVFRVRRHLRCLCRKRWRSGRAIRPATASGPLPP